MIPQKIREFFKPVVLDNIISVNSNINTIDTNILIFIDLDLYFPYINKRITLFLGIEFLMYERLNYKISKHEMYINKSSRFCNER